MSELRSQYWRVISSVSRLQRELMNALNNSVNLIAVNAADEIFVPSHNTLLEQLSNWPNGMFPIPPAAWVHPRTGAILMLGQTWNYVLHGNGVTFANTSNEEEVGIEFGMGGEIALTSWIVYIYLKNTPSEWAEKSQLVSNNNALFEEFVESGDIVPVPPRLPGSDQTFVLQGSIS
ncbi:MAG: hypothetical protein HGA19_20115 [Oscillochloris sp.]|nr:hypothetical protein [Oscillochloris sp.]